MFLLWFGFGLIYFTRFEVTMAPIVRNLLYVIGKRPIDAINEYLKSVSKEG